MTTNLVHNGGQRSSSIQYPTFTWNASGSWTNSYGEIRSYTNSTDRDNWENGQKTDVVDGSTTYYMAYKPNDSAHDAQEFPTVNTIGSVVHLQNGSTVDWWDRFISFDLSALRTAFSNSANGTFSASGSGSGGGGGFLSNNPLIENVYFAKNSDSSIALGFDWENISSYKVWVDRAGTITTHELFLTGSSGSITGYTGSGANALNNLGEGDKVWLTEGNNDDTIVDGYGSIGNPYSHQIVVWSKDSEKVYAKCFGDVTFSGGQSSAGTKATRLRGGKSYGSYESPTTNEITHELPRGLGKYQIELWTTTSGNPTSYVDYGSFFRDSSQVTCNFW